MGYFPIDLYVKTYLNLIINNFKFKFKSILNNNNNKYIISFKITSKEETNKKIIKANSNKN